MKTSVHPGPAPIAVVAVGCPWCESTVLLESPLADEFRCTACWTTVEIAPDAQPAEPVLSRAA